MPSLAAHVHIRDDAGNVVVLAPGDEVPAWAAVRITNPMAWEGGVAPTAPEPEPAKTPVKRAAPRRKAAPSDDAVHGG